MEDLKNRYTGLETVYGRIEHALATPLSRGEAVVVRAPTDTTVVDIIERLIGNFTDDDMRRMATALGLDPKLAHHRMSIELELKKAFYRANPAIAARLEDNRVRRLDAAVEDRVLQAA